MKLNWVHRETTGDYIVCDDKRQIGILYEKECPELGHCWVLSIQTPGIFMRRSYIYSSPESAKAWLPREIRDEKTENELYHQVLDESYQFCPSCA